MDAMLKLALMAVMVLVALGGAEAKKRTFIERIQKSMSFNVQDEPGDRYTAITKFRLPNGAPACEIDGATGLPTNAAPMRAYLEPSNRATRKTSVYLVEIDFNPCGHPPNGKWTIPHFDIHWYHRNPDSSYHPQDESVVCTPPPGYPFDFVCNDEEWLAQPEGAAAGNLAEGLTPDDHGVQNMGLHWFNHDIPDQADWIDPVFIQGTYDGEFIFYELMFPPRTIQEGGFHYFAPVYPDKTLKFLPDMLMTWTDGEYAYMQVSGQKP